MSASALIVAVGQRLAGDDGAGPAVIDHLRGSPLPPGVTVAEVREPSALLPLFERGDKGGERPRTLVLVDGVLASPAGEVLALTADDIETRNLVSVSSHGLSVGQAVALGRAVNPDGGPRAVHVVAITITSAARGVPGLSASVAAAVPRAAARALALATEVA